VYKRENHQSAKELIKDIFKIPRTYLSSKNDLSTNIRNLKVLNIFIL